MDKFNLSTVKNKKIALVLSGGVVKAAAWHLGVALALEEMGFSLKNNKITDPTKPAPSLEIGTYVGSSAGSIISLFFAAGFTPNDVIQSTLGMKNSKLKGITYRDMLSLKKNLVKPPKTGLYHPFDGFPPIIKQMLKPIGKFSGFFTTEGIRQYLLKNIIDTDSFEDYSADLFIVATQLDHSRKVIFSKYNYPNPTHDSTSTYYTGAKVSDAVTASMSVPPFYSPSPVQNSISGEIEYYIDGEIRETLSTHVAEDNGCEVIISSWTHTPYHYHDEIGSLVNYGLPNICVQAIHLMIQKKIVSNRASRATSRDILNTIHDYMKLEKFSDKHRKDILSIVEKKLNYKPHVKLIDIYPDYSDYKTFFANSFSLNPKTSEYVVKAGYKKTMEIFRQYKDA